jgi:mannose-1-phosphate guanylyltransferase
VEAGSLFGFPDRDAYWLDIGTPERYLQGTFDILAGDVSTETTTDGRRAWFGEGVAIDGSAEVGELVVLGPGVKVGAGSAIERSVVLEGAVVGAGCRLSDCIVAQHATLGDGSVVGRGAIVGERATVAAGVTLGEGAKLEPGEIAGKSF